MSDHGFQMRLSTQYERPDNTVSELTVQNLEDGEWKDFDLNFQQPGFVMFTYTILNCQHLYFRVNAAERGLLLESASGSIDVLADNDWKLKKLHVRFEGKVGEGQPNDDTVNYIANRMGHCPVSINLMDVPDERTEVVFNRN